MPERSRKGPRHSDLDAATIVANATCQQPAEPTKSVKPPGAKKNPHAVALGRKGGKVGGKARAASLTAEERRAIALRAARARWGIPEDE
jgi:hypothetical protein